MMQSVPARDLRALPKAHLHLHLSAALRPALLNDFLDGAPLPRLEARDGTFTTFLRQMATVTDLFRTVDDYARAIEAMAEDAAAEGVVWLEPSTALRAQRLGLRTEEAMLEALVDAADQALRTTGVGIGFIVTPNRTRSPQDATRLAKLAARYAGRGVVSFGLADDEAVGPAESFAEAFTIARDAGLIRAPHAGEHAGPESVRAALDALGAQRVQHGVRAIEDPELVRRLADEQVCLDVCPTSNVHLSVVPDLERHPLPALMAAGVPVSLNADCPSVFGCGVLDEYELARATWGLSDSALAQIAASSIRNSGAPEQLRSRALASIDAWLQVDGNSPWYRSG
jgi:adenosine deaminase